VKGPHSEGNDTSLHVVLIAKHFKAQNRAADECGRECERHTYFEPKLFSEHGGVSMNNSTGGTMNTLPPVGCGYHLMKLRTFPSGSAGLLNDNAIHHSDPEGASFR